MSGKRHPMLGAAWSSPAISGKKFNGQPSTWLGTAGDLVTPLSPKQAYETYQIDDFDAATVGSVANLFGFDIKPDYQSPLVMAYESASPEEFKKKAGSILHAATDPTASAGEKAIAKKILAGLSKEDAVKALYDTVQEKRIAGSKSKGLKHPLTIQDSSGKLTEYGLRVSRLNFLIEE
jgi:hypothetical protein